MNKIRSFFCLVLTMLLLMGNAGTVEQWDTDVNKVSSHSVSAYHGDDISLECKMHRNGKLYNPYPYYATFMWQTNGMGNGWWSTNATISAGIVKADFTPYMDPGAKKVIFFFNVIDKQGASYRVNGNITFSDSPAGDMSNLPLPLKILDFKYVQVYNPTLSPFALKGQGGDVDYGIVTNISGSIVSNCVNRMALGHTLGGSVTNISGNVVSNCVNPFALNKDFYPQNVISFVNYNDYSFEDIPYWGDDSILLRVMDLVGYETYSEEYPAPDTNLVISLIQGDGVWTKRLGPDYEYQCLLDTEDWPIIWEGKVASEEFVTKNTSNFVPVIRKINGIPLTNDITISTIETNSVEALIKSFAETNKLHITESVTGDVNRLINEFSTTNQLHLSKTATNDVNGIVYTYISTNTFALTEVQTNSVNAIIKQFAITNQCHLTDTATNDVIQITSRKQDLLYYDNNYFTNWQVNNTNLVKGIFKNGRLIDIYTNQIISLKKIAYDNENKRWEIRLIWRDPEDWEYIDTETVYDTTHGTNTEVLTSIQNEKEEYGYTTVTYPVTNIAVRAYISEKVYTGAKVDMEPTSNSVRVITSGAVRTAIDTTASKLQSTLESTFTEKISKLSSSIDGKQNKLYSSYYNNYWVRGVTNVVAVKNPSGVAEVGTGIVWQVRSVAYDPLNSKWDIEVDLVDPFFDDELDEHFYDSSSPSNATFLISDENIIQLPYGDVSYYRPITNIVIRPLIKQYCGDIVDLYPITNSLRLVTSGGVKSELNRKYEKPSDGIGFKDLSTVVSNAISKGITKVYNDLNTKAMAVGGDYGLYTNLNVKYVGTDGNNIVYYPAYFDLGCPCWTGMMGTTRLELKYAGDRIWKYRAGSGTYAIIKNTDGYANSIPLQSGVGGNVIRKQINGDVILRKEDIVGSSRKINGQTLDKDIIITPTNEVSMVYDDVLEKHSGIGGDFGMYTNLNVKYVGTNNTEEVIYYPAFAEDNGTLCWTGRVSILAQNNMYACMKCENGNVWSFWIYPSKTKRGYIKNSNPDVVDLSQTGLYSIFGELLYRHGIDESHLFKIADVVPSTRKVNGVPLSGDINIIATNEASIIYDNITNKITAVGGDFGLYTNVPSMYEGVASSISMHLMGVEDGHCVWTGAVGSVGTLCKMWNIGGKWWRMESVLPYPGWIGYGTNTVDGQYIVWRDTTIGTFKRSSELTFVKYANIVPSTLKINGMPLTNDITITTSGITTNDVNNIISSSNLCNMVAVSNYVSSVLPTNRYALFIVNINPSGSTNTIFRDIELKGTTNNFNSSDGANPLVYFMSTAYNELDVSVEGETMDWCRLYVLSYAADDDVRKWVRIKNTSSLGISNAKELAILIDPIEASMIRRGQGNKWCYERNDELIWSYVRYKTNDSPELSDDGVHQLWRPIMPIKWYNKLPSWANQSEKSNIFFIH